MDRDMKPTPAENRVPSLPDAEIDDAFDEAMARAMGVDDETLAAVVVPSGARDAAIHD